MMVLDTCTLLWLAAGEGLPALTPDPHIRAYPGAPVEWG